MKRLLHLAALTVAAVATVPAGAAEGHVTLQPDAVPAGAFTRLDVRVPNERDNASTKKVEVKFPAGFIFASYEPVAGWTAKVKLAALAKPVVVFGEKHAEQVDTITFSATGRGVRPGQFQDFGLSLGLPDKPGATLTFKAVQTYSNGEVVRWIGARDADQPAPQVKLTAAPSADAGAPSQAPAAQATPAPGSDDGEHEDANALSVVALIVGTLGLLAGLAGLAAARRARSTAGA
jgi:uncharacterized protein